MIRRVWGERLQVAVAVLEDGEGSEGGGFGAEDAGAELDDVCVGVLEEVVAFSGGEAAFGADPEGDGVLRGEGWW